MAQLGEMRRLTDRLAWCTGVERLFAGIYRSCRSLKIPGLMEHLVAVVLSFILLYQTPGGCTTEGVMRRMGQIVTH